VNRRRVRAGAPVAPGILPLVSPDGFVSVGALFPTAVAPIRANRGHNALLFDFVLKRSVAQQGRRFASRIFATRPHFTTSS